MFDHGDAAPAEAVEPAVIDAAMLAGLRTELWRVDGAGCSQVERLELLEQAERLKGALAAVQARVACRFDEAQRAVEADRGVPAGRRGRDVGAQVALARRESPHRGNRDLGFARALVHEMPHTHVALARGDISEWRATLMVRETATLTVADRRTVDAELAQELPGLDDRATAARARRCGYRLDPASVIRRTRAAASARRVSLRPAPDTMSLLTMFLPVAQGVAVYKSLTEAAATAKATGDRRGRGQLMADLSVERLTGQATAEAVPVEIELVMTDATLLRGDSEPAELVGYGPVPAPTARELVRDNPATAWLRRLFAARGRLIAAESERRVFPSGMRRFLIWRDQTCRTPWCDAPIRHVDHVVPVADGGVTSLVNGQGLCEACNYTKQAPGWQTRTEPDQSGGPGRVVITTPTGHTYPSHAPPPPGTPPPLPRPHTPRLIDIIWCGDTARAG